MNNYSEHRLLLPETIWLESEDYQQASAISGLTEKKQSWQIYLNLLGLFGLQTWLSERLPHHQISPKIDSSKQTYYLQVGDFTVGAIATENLLDEVVDFPQQPLQWATHFYVLLEIIEEAEEAILRGLLRYDHLEAYLAERQPQPSNDSYQLPLALFDSEPNHLLFYCQYLEPEAITLPVGQTEATPSIQETLAASRTKLSQWLQDTLIEGWLTIETLIDPQMNLALSTRSFIQEYKRGKLINLGVELNNVTMVLLVTVKQEDDDKLSVLIQLYPSSREENFLPPQVQLTLLSKAGKILQSVQAREQDNYIQLKPFRGQLSKRFSLEISLENTSLREDFEL